ncbi:hypothetical protein BD779DRAFT_1501345 [Infundibulicybe gibba]|nr:hypothetical protein BD779DRAFT_1501345 [Infundibulicybe gibba]
MITPKVKHTYSSRQNRLPTTSSPASSLPWDPPVKRKRSLNDSSVTTADASNPKRAKIAAKRRQTLKSKENHGQKTLTQLHFCIDQTVLRTCPRCNFTYTKGAPDDETLHRSHCARVQRGMEWGREEEKEKDKAGLVEIATSVKLKDGSKGRIISFKADVGGKIGSKLTSLLETINVTLSSPPLTPSILRDSKAYLFLLPPVLSGGREKIVGCVIAQRISTAMAIANSLDGIPSGTSPSLIAVDAAAGVFCHPKPLPTPMGVPRLFVPSTHRRQGIASKLLSAAAETFIHGCILDPQKGHVAFTQPTGDGGGLMRRWGGGGVRIYEE